MAITDEKKNLQLGHDSETLITNSDDNFTSLFDTVDDLNEAIETKEPKIETKCSAFNKNFATAQPAMDGTASAGETDTVARGDHVHPHDTSKLDAKPDGTNVLIQNSKINTVYLPDSVLGQLIYQGTFNASTAGTKNKTKGHYYICATAGSYNPDGTTGNTYAVGDWAVYNGSSWDKVDNTDAVTLVNGQTGSVRTYKGAYASETQYYQGDIVLSNSCLYLYINETASSGTAISNSTYWKILGMTYGNATESESGLMSSTDKQKLNAIDDSLKDITADEIGKVKDVQVNNISVVQNGIANIDLSNISLEVEELAIKYDDEISLTTYKDGEKTYKAIAIKETDVAFELLNAKGKAVVTQVIRANGNIYYCLPSTDNGTYTLQRVGGSVVGGGSLSYATSANAEFPAIYKSDFVNSSSGEFTETTMVEGRFISINRVDIPKNGAWVKIREEAVESNEVIPQGSSTGGQLPPRLILNARYDLVTNTTYLKSVITVVPNAYYSINLKSRIVNGLLATDAFTAVEHEVAEIKSDIAHVKASVEDLENENKPVLHRIQLTNWNLSQNVTALNVENESNIEKVTISVISKSSASIVSVKTLAQLIKSGEAQLVGLNGYIKTLFTEFDIQANTVSPILDLIIEDADNGEYLLRFYFASPVFNGESLSGYRDGYINFTTGESETNASDITVLL